MAKNIKVVAVNMIKYNGEKFLPGTLITIDEDEAIRLLELGVVNPADEAQPKPVLAPKSKDKKLEDLGGEETTEQTPAEELCRVKGINEELARALVKEGINGIADLQKTAQKVLVAIPGIGKKSAKAILKDAKTFTIED